MNEAKTYRFSTFQELVDRVPADRIRPCLEELGVFLSTAKATAELTLAVAIHLAKENMEIPASVIEEISASVIKLPDELTWIDDGKGDIGVNLHTGDKDKPLLSYKITKEP